MSKSKGLPSGGLLGNHLGFAVPMLVRRTPVSAEPTPSQVEDEAAQGSVEAPPVIANVEAAPVVANVEPAATTAEVVLASIVEKPAAVIPPVETVSAALQPAVSSPAVPPKHVARQPKPRAEPSDDATHEKELKAASYRVGTRENPHRRVDGTQTQKLTFTAPHGLHREINLFCQQNNLNRSEWMVATLQEAMERHGRDGSR